jgi:hypothetical protein
VSNEEKEKEEAYNELRKIHKSYGFTDKEVERIINNSKILTEEYEAKQKRSDAYNFELLMETINANSTDFFNILKSNGIAFAHKDLGDDRKIMAIIGYGTLSDFLKRVREQI